MAITSKKGRYSTSAKAISGSKLNYLLDESEDSELSDENSKEALFSCFCIEEDSYEFPIEDNVPAGYYISEIDKVDVRIKRGVKMLDVSYCIWNNDSEYYILQSYPENSPYMKKFSKAMVAAGVKPGADPRKTIGVKEKINLQYWNDNSDIGSIVKRIPYQPKPASEDADGDVNEE